MARQAQTQPTTDERKIAAIVRRLLPERSAQVLAFARFIAYETFKPDEIQFLEKEEIFEDVETENDAHWEALFASETGQNALDQLADEALAEIRIKSM